MLADIRRLVEAHIASQQEVLAELRELRAEVARLAGSLDGLSATAPQKAHVNALGHRLAATAAEQRVAAVIAQDGRHADPLSLPRHHAQVYSQNGEDGMIAEIFRRIGTRDRSFLEVGVESGIQNNTRLLLEQGWSGIWVEGSQAHARAAAERFAGPIAEGRLTIINALAKPDALDGLLDGAGMAEAIDFVSLDIDHQTSHLWRGLRRRARVACIEYNASIPPCLPIEVPAAPDGAWDGTNWFGAGLKALEAIGMAKGMHLVGCDLNGVNAFFVDAAETAGRFRAPYTAEAHFEPPQLRLSTHLGHRASPQARQWVAAPEATGR